MDGVALSVVVPVYGCATVLGDLHRRVVAAVEPVEPSFELVLVDDRAADDPWPTIARLSEQDPRVRGVRLSRNFGQQAAITAGLSQARGERVVVMDCDLQDPPEEIPRLLAAADGGYDIVLARRIRKRMPLWRRAAGRVYFRSLRTVAGVDLDGSVGAFSLISRQVVDAFLSMKDRDRHYTLILSWLGFSHTTIDYDVHERAVGRSSYTLRSLVTHALDGIFFQTTALLRFIVIAGFGFAAAGMVTAFWILIAQFTGSLLPGWASLAFFTLTIGGFTITSLGVIGLYLGKVFDQVRERPLFIIERTSADDREGAE